MLKNATLTTLVGILLLVILALTVLVGIEIGHAEFYVEAGAGAATYTSPHDGNWIQKAWPHALDESDAAWKISVAYQATPQWAVKASYVNLGAFKVQTDFVDDDKYDVSKHGCREGKDCSRKLNMTGSDAYKAYTLSVIRTFNAEEAFSQFLELGGGLMTHGLSVHCCNDVSGAPGNPTTFAAYYGRIPVITLGGGLCLFAVCFETLLYHKLNVFGSNYGDIGYPMTDAIITTMFTFKVPLGV